MPYMSGYEACPPPPLLGCPPPPPPPFLAAPPPPPPTPENGPRVGRSRRMARCYAPPPVNLTPIYDKDDAEGVGNCF